MLNSDLASFIEYLGELTQYMALTCDPDFELAKVAMGETLNILKQPDLSPLQRSVLMEAKRRMATVTVTRMFE